MTARRWLVGLLVAAAVGGAVAAPPAQDSPNTAAVRAMLTTQQNDWNRGDIDAFMRGYWKDESIRFAGGDTIRSGWQATIDRYHQRYPDRAAMGKLQFELVELRPLSQTVVYVFGKWHLTRENEAVEKAPHGLFTLLVERKDGRWVITRDHTSTAGG